MELFAMQNSYITGSIVVVSTGMTIYRITQGDVAEIPLDLLITTAATAIGQYGALVSGYYADLKGTGIVKDVGYVTIASCLTPIPGVVTALSSLALRTLF